MSPNSLWRIRRGYASIPRGTLARCWSKLRAERTGQGPILLAPFLWQRRICPTHRRLAGWTRNPRARCRVISAKRWRRQGRAGNMCGIAGIVGGRATARAAIERMLDTLRHRGPDDGAVQLGRGAALGHRRLSIIDLDGGRQPIGNEDGTKWIVCNGEIYNYRGADGRAGGEGPPLPPPAPTPRWCCISTRSWARPASTGCAACSPSRSGTTRAGRLFAARDHLGQKPLFYYRSAGDELAFASEIKGAAAAPSGRAIAEPRRPAPVSGAADHRPAADDVPTGSASCRPATASAIQQARGHQDPRATGISTYEPKLQGTEEELLEALEHELIEAVRLHMVSDVPVGAFLSGGLDSTLVVAMARSHASAGPMPTFTMGLPLRRLRRGAGGSPGRRALRHGPPRRGAGTIADRATCRRWSIISTSLPTRSRSAPTWSARWPGGTSRWSSAATAATSCSAATTATTAISTPATTPPCRPACDASSGHRLLPLVPDGGWYKSKGHQLRVAAPGLVPRRRRALRTEPGLLLRPPRTAGGLFGPALAASLGKLRSLRGHTRGLRADQCRASDRPHAPCRQPHPAARPSGHDPGPDVDGARPRGAQHRSWTTRSPSSPHVCRSSLKVRWRTLRYVAAAAMRALPAA